jgi:AcrR family transcriptional regulator
MRVTETSSAITYSVVKVKHISYMTVKIQGSESRMSQPATRRRRADAERSIAAILDAAIDVLRRRPDASVEDIATMAGLSRQTVYAHFASRAALLTAVLDRATDEAVAAVDAADIDKGAASEAFVRLLDATWQTFEGYPFLLHAPAVPTSPADDAQRHEPIIERLQRLLRRGQAEGEFDPALPTAWLVAATIALGHAAGDEVGAGRMTVEDAARALRCSALRLVGTDTTTTTTTTKHRQRTPARA